MARAFLRTSVVYFLIAIGIALLTKPGAWVSFPGTVTMAWPIVIRWGVSSAG